MDAIQAFITDLEATLMAIAGSAAVIGVLGLGFMYLGATLPGIRDWKAANPTAFRDVGIGLGCLMFAGGGGVAVLLGF